MSEAHAYNAFHGALSFRSLFQVPGESPPVLRVEGWYLDGATAGCPVACSLRSLRPSAPGSSASRRLSYADGPLWRWEPRLEADLREARLGATRDDSAMRRFEPLFRVPSGFAQWMQELLRDHPGDRPRAARARSTTCSRSTASAGRFLQERSMRDPDGASNEPTGSAAKRSMRPYRYSLSGGSRWSEGGHLGSLWSRFRLCAEQRRTEVLLLDGEAGVGKTRLADWLFTARREGLSDGLQVRHGAGGAEGSALLGALQRHLQSEALDAEALLDRCAQWLRRAGEGRRTIAQLLAALVRDGGGMSRKSAIRRSEA